jgi:hypothetical protein
MEKGLIYHPKQLMNIFPGIKIYITDDKKLYIEKEGKYVKARKFVKNELYQKDFEWYINQIVMMENCMINNSLLILVFIGDEKIGKILLEKMNEYKTIQSFTIGICFRNKNLYERLKDNVIKNFNYYGLFISKEYGNDIIPTLQIYNKIKFIIKFDKIIKLHTKTSDISWFNDLTNFLITKTTAELLTMQHFKSNCVGHIDYYTKDDNSNINIKILGKYSDIINKDFYFVRGSMFYCDKKVFEKIIDLIKIDYKMYFNNNLYDTNNINFTNSAPHALERLFGIIKI